MTCIRNIFNGDFFNTAVVVNILQTEILATESNGTVLVCIVVENAVRRALNFVMTPKEDDSARGMNANNCDVL